VTGDLTGIDQGLGQRPHPGPERRVYHARPSDKSHI